MTCDVRARSATIYSRGVGSQNWLKTKVKTSTRKYPTLFLAREGRMCYLYFIYKKNIIFFAPKGEKGVQIGRATRVHCLCPDMLRFYYCCAKKWICADVCVFKWCNRWFSPKDLFLIDVNKEIAREVNKVRIMVILCVVVAKLRS